MVQHIRMWFTLHNQLGAPNNSSTNNRIESWYMHIWIVFNIDRHDSDICIPYFKVCAKLKKKKNSFSGLNFIDLKYRKIFSLYKIT
jgi:hypothetical protein